MNLKQNLPIFSLGLLVGLAVFAVYNFVLPAFFKSSVAENVRKLYQLALPGMSFEVENIKDIGNLYEIWLAFPNQQGRLEILKVYASKDGRYATENIIYIHESIQQIEKMKSFVDCLFDKGLRVYGATQTNNTAINSGTLLQLMILGRYSTKLYVSCDGDNLQACIRSGLQALPSIVYNNTAYPGVYSAEYLANLTGCKL